MSKNCAHLKREIININKIILSRQHDKNIKNKNSTIVTSDCMNYPIIIFVTMLSITKFVP